MGPQKAGVGKAVTCWAWGGGGEWRLPPCLGLPGATFLGIPDRVAAASGPAGLISRRLLLTTG